MYKFLIKRLLMMIPVVLGISIIVFSIMSLTPGDPARLILGEKASKQAINDLRDKMGLNKPFIVRYFNFVGNALHGDFGRSYRTNRPVFDEIFSRFPTTIKLTVSGMLLAVIFGIPIGIISATKQYSFIDAVSMVFALLAASVPAFWLGLMLIIIFALNLGWLPSCGFSSIKAMILPSVTLAAVSSAVIVRMTRSSMLEVIRQDFIRTARAKGASEGRIIRKHAISNALIPIITIIGINFGYLLGGAILTETVFAIPGLGTLLVTAIRMKDIPTVLATVTVLAIAFSLINLIVDILYAWIDPRIKAQYGA